MYCFSISGRNILSPSGFRQVFYEVLFIIYFALYALCICIEGNKRTAKYHNKNIEKEIHNEDNDDDDDDDDDENNNNNNNNNNSRSKNNNNNNNSDVVIKFKQSYFSSLNSNLSAFYARHSGTNGM